MIRISEQKNAKSAKRCYAAADYYRDGRGMVGCWGGKGVSRLGLNGIVDRGCFRRLCDNLDPRAGHRVTPRTYSNRAVGYDFIFSVSKSVSLLYGLSGDHAILEAFRAAVNESMREMEGELKTRVRKGGQEMDAQPETWCGRNSSILPPGRLRDFATRNCTRMLSCSI